MRRPTPDRQAVVDRVQRIVREKIAPRAAAIDREARNPVESWADLHREGFLAAAVPTPYGGLGLDMATYVAVLGTIARGCASTAMTFQMHSTVLRFVDALCSEAQKRRWFREVVEHGKMFASWGSEPAVSISRSFVMETAVRADGADLVIDGVKYFCTMALGAAYYMVYCAVDGETDPGKAILQVLVPAETPGLSTDGKWDTLGMRGTYSPSVKLERVRVSADHALGRPGQALQVGVVEAYALGYAAIYLAIAEAAFDFAADYARKRVVKPDNVAIAQDAAVQRHLGGLRVKLDAARAILEEGAAGWEGADVIERGYRANRAKFLATETALEVTEKVIQVVGGRGASKDHPLERAFRDVRTATLMPPTVDRMLEMIGKNALGIADAMFKA